MNKPNRLKPGLHTLMLAAMLSCLALAPVGCGTLDSSGVYAGDKVLYDADVVIASNYELLHSFVKFEYENREALANAPEVRKFADDVRRGSPQWFASALALRDAYRTNPGDQTRSALQAALDVIRAATIQATKYLVQQSAAATPGRALPSGLSPPK